MKLYIKYIDGKIVDHPMLEENLRQVNPQFDPSSPPNDLKVFERVAAPILGPYVKMDHMYQLQSDDIVRDVYTEVGYTAEERAARIAHAMELAHPNGWIFNEDICGWEAPSAPPTDGTYTWSNEEETWVKVTI